MKFIIGKEFEKKRLFVVSPTNYAKELLVIAKNHSDAKSRTKFHYQSSGVNLDISIRVDEYGMENILLKEFSPYKHPVRKLLDCLPCGVIGCYWGINMNGNMVYCIAKCYHPMLEKL